MLQFKLDVITFDALKKCQMRMCLCNFSVLDLLFEFHKELLLKS